MAVLVDVADFFAVRFGTTARASSVGAPVGADGAACADGVRNCWVTKIRSPRTTTVMDTRLNSGSINGNECR